MSKVVTLGLVQMSMSHSSEDNRKKAREMVREAAKKGAQIVCLPELFTSPYFCVIEDAGFEYAEPIPGPTSQELSEIAKENNVTLVGGSYHEKAGAKYFNTSLIFDSSGAQIGSYRKTHIPHDDSFYEQHYFSPGDTGFRVFSVGGVRLGVLICYDQWYPEAARSNALLGADIVFYPTAIGNVDSIEQTEGNWQEAWENVQRGHAIANAMVVAAVNRVGTEGHTKFWGGSFVCNAFGKTLIRGTDQEEILVQAIDLEHSQKVREGWRFFYNRRPDQYTTITTAK